MKTLLIFTFLVSTVMANAAPITLNSYTLPDDWLASDFSHTIGSPTGMPYTPYSFAAILSKDEVERMASLFSTSTDSAIKMPNGSTLKVEQNLEYKPQFDDDLGITFSIEGPEHQKLISEINLSRGMGVVLKYLKTETASPTYLLFQIK